MIKIDETKCIGCGQCVDDCSYSLFKMENGVAKINAGSCNLCAHCVAICPAKAISMDEYDCSECVEKSELKLGIDPITMLDTLKYRRAVRQFNGKHVEDEKLNRILEAGRYAPTGSNAQDVRYIMPLDRLKVVDMCLDGLVAVSNLMGQNYDRLTEIEKRYMQSFRRLRKEFDESGKTKDVIFFGCDRLIAIVSVSDINAGIAAQAMMMQAVSEGLGVLYNGFFRRGVESNPKLREYLGIKSNEKMFTSLCIGYTDLDYARTAPRKLLNLTVIE